MKFYFLLAMVLCGANFSIAQDRILDSLVYANKKIFFYENGKFSGEQIDTLVATVSRHKYVLIGEQHHTNEIPIFLDYVLQRINFDNYVMEGNQSISNLLGQTLKKSPSDYQELIKRHTDRFGFYTFKRDRKLLEDFILADKPVIELDQVFASSDVPLLEDLSRSTKNKSAKMVYDELIGIAETRWSKYAINHGVQPPFDLKGLPLLFSKEISEKLQPLLTQKISEKEKQEINDLMQSNAIYTTAIDGRGLQSHEMRISLMKKNLLSNYYRMAGKRNLFKFGANHVTKYKSLGQGTPDVGNFVLNLAEAEGQKSLHIAILEKSGKIGGLFGESIDVDGEPYLKLFSELSESKNEWMLFDLKKINREVKKQKINIRSCTLANFIDGFDYLIIIPEVTPQVKL